MLTKLEIGGVLDEFDIQLKPLVSLQPYARAASEIRYNFVDPNNSIWDGIFHGCLLNSVKKGR